MEGVIDLTYLPTYVIHKYLFALRVVLLLVLFVFFCVYLFLRFCVVVWALWEVLIPWLGLLSFWDLGVRGGRLGGRGRYYMIRTRGGGSITRQRIARPGYRSFLVLVSVQYVYIEIIESKR